MGIFDTSFYIFHFALHIPLIGSINLNGIYKNSTHSVYFHIR